jgi:type VI secretion system protein ImpG
MSDELLPYYNSELSFIRRLGAEFARAYPKQAERLQWKEEATADPHVERLIEAFAFLNARIRHKLDDDFPEIADAMLGVLYPHYQTPLPSMAVIQFVINAGQGDLASGYTIPRDSELETEPVEGEPCRFRTCYPATLWPIEVVGASLMSRPFAAPATSHTADSVAVLRLELQCLTKELTFAQLAMPSLRFFLKGQGQHVYPLYELIFNHVRGVALAAAPQDPRPTVLPRDCLQPVGFGRDEGMLPYSARSLLGYRLLTEYFAFPEKYLLFDLTGLNARVLAGAGQKLEVYFYLDRTIRELEQNVTKDMFQLGCAPVVNLYRQQAEPIPITHTETAYRVVPDVRRPLAGEIYSIERVTAVSADNERVEYRPFYSFKHASDREVQRRFWHAVRQPAEKAAGQVDHGTELFLSLVDLDFSPSSPTDWTLEIQTTCLNRDLPNRLPFGGGQPKLRLSTGAPIARIECLTRPTGTLRPPLKRGALWRLISHLSLNHLSLADYEEGADALREILKLYDFSDSAETRSTIDGILNVRTRRVVGRDPRDTRGGFCRGLEVTVHFDEDRFVGSGLFLFACVLERFLGLYCSINSFSKLIATTNKREGELRRWAPRAGETALL